LRRKYKKVFKNKYLELLLAAGMAWVVVLCPLWATNAAAQVAFVLNSRDDSVSLIDTKTYKEISRTRVGREPHHLMATPDDKSLIVGSVQSNDLVFYDPVSGAFQKRIKDISDPYQMGFTPDRKWFVSASLALDRVDIYSAHDFKLVKRLPTPRGPSHIIFSQDNRHVFVTLQTIKLSRTLRWASSRRASGLRRMTDMCWSV
jgi:YVTN family beta-propeller protein